MRFSEIPAELENFANLPNLLNISANHKKTKCMDPKWLPILELTMVLVALMLSPLLAQACIVHNLGI